MKIVYMGTPEIASVILKGLCANNLTPSLVVTQIAKAQGRGHKILPSAVETTAKELGLRVLSTEKISAGDDFETLKKEAPDLILVAAFGQILKENVLTLPKIACLNVHASLLPKYRGAAPFQRAIWNGDKVTGITIQKMAKKLDTGAILLQKETPIFPHETSGDLLNRLGNLGSETLVEAVKLIQTGNFSFREQNESQASYAPKIEKSDALIHWNKTAEEIHNQIRALQPWPIAEAFLDSNRLRIYKTAISTGPSGVAPGRIETDSKKELRVACQNGTWLSILEVQQDNKKRMTTQEFLSQFRGSFPYSSFQLS